MRTSRGRWAWRALVGAVGTVLLLGCGLAGCSPAGGDPEPTPSRSSAAVSPSPSATPSPSPTPEASVKPERPAAMDQVSVAGAEAVATYFLQLYPYVYATGDLTEWKALSHPECVFCASVMTNVEELHSQGHTNEGSEVEVHSVDATEVTIGRWFSVEASVTQAPSIERDAQGATVEEHPTATQYTMTFAVVFDSVWQVRELDLVAVPDGA